MQVTSGLEIMLHCDLYASRCGASYTDPMNKYDLSFILDQLSPSSFESDSMWSYSPSKTITSLDYMPKGSTAAFFCCGYQFKTMVGTQKTVEPPIMDSPRYRPPPYYIVQQTNSLHLIDFAIEIIHF